MGVPMIEYSREFICLSSDLNYAKTAKKLHISQPSLSRHIADLEKELGFKLFERAPLALTPAGKFYLESISGIIEQIDDVVEKGRSIAGEGDGAITVSMVPFDLGVYSNVIYESVAILRASHPGSMVQFYMSKSHSVYEALLAGKADVAVMFVLPDDLPKGIASTVLMEYPCMIWAHRDNPALKSASPAVEDFSSCKLISSNNKLFSEWHAANVAALGRCGVELGSRMRDIENAPDYFVSMRPDEIHVTSAVGIACPYNPNVVGVRFDDDRFTFPTYLVYRDTPNRPAVKRFIETCLSVGQKYMNEVESYSFATTERQ